MPFKPLLTFTLLGSALATSVLSRTPLSLNLPVSVAQQHKASSHRALGDLNGRAQSPSPVVQITNAERMVAGLPPLPSRRRGSRTSHAARAARSVGGPATHEYFAARAAGTSTLLKWDYNIFGENGLTSSSTDGALKVILPAEEGLSVEEGGDEGTIDTGTGFN